MEKSLVVNSKYFEDSSSSFF